MNPRSHIRTLSISSWLTLFCSVTEIIEKCRSGFGFHFKQFTVSKLSPKWIYHDQWIHNSDTITVYRADKAWVEEGGCCGVMYHWYIWRQLKYFIVPVWSCWERRCGTSVVVFGTVTRGQRRFGPLCVIPTTITNFGKASFSSSQEFPNGRREPKQWGSNLIFGHICPENCMEIKKLDRWECARPWRLLGCANRFSTQGQIPWEFKAYTYKIYWNLIMIKFERRSEK